MIVGVPDGDQLHETAVSWLNLAWEITIREVGNFHEIGTVFDNIEKEHGPAKAEAEVQKFWRAAQYKLNNAISLLQQSLEIFLKARIAYVSPFLLILGDPHSWPKPDATGNIDFSNFRTLDAVQLYRAVNSVSATPLPDKFSEFFDRIRRTRNKITHLNSGNVEAEAKSVLVDILTAHRFLFPGDLWVAFRKDYMVSTQQYSDDDVYFDGEDHTHDALATEIGAALDGLESDHLKLFFQYDDSKKGMRCPKCLELRTDWSDREWPFAQMQDDGKIRCIACLSVYTKQQYKDHIREFFSYLDEGERREIGEELDGDLP